MQGLEKGAKRSEPYNFILKTQTLKPEYTNWFLQVGYGLYKNFASSLWFVPVCASYRKACGEQTKD